MISRFLGTGAGHVALGLRSEPDIATADTTPEPEAIFAVSGADSEVNSDDENISDNDRLLVSDGEDGEDEEEELDEFLSSGGKARDDMWESDDDAGPEDDDPAYDYDYSN